MVSPDLCTELVKYFIHTVSKGIPGTTYIVGYELRPQCITDVEARVTCYIVLGTTRGFGTMWMELRPCAFGMTRVSLDESVFCN